MSISDIRGRYNNSIDNLINLYGLIVRGMFARLKVNHRQVPGLRFDNFGRYLAFKQLIAERKLSNEVVRGLANPVSCVRYFEFAFLEEIAEKNNTLNEGIQVLDISSPRLWPFWLAEKHGAYVTMVNPDTNDIKTSRCQVGYLKYPDRITMTEGVDATSLPFVDDSFDLATSVSVIEHINGEGDTKMMSELIRVTKPGGLVALTFPVKPKFDIEYRDTKHYGTQQYIEGKGYFFQRFYDLESIHVRILDKGRIKEIARRYYIENPPGWFTDYEQLWREYGLEYTLNDPVFMAEHFCDAGDEHPSYCMGICCLVMEVR